METDLYCKALALNMEYGDQEVLVFFFFFLLWHCSAEGRKKLFLGCFVPLNVSIWTQI